MSVINLSNYNGANDWPVTQYKLFYSMQRPPAILTSGQHTAHNNSLSNNLLYRTRTRVTRKGFIVTREQYKKMCGSVVPSKGIASSYLVKFQMTFQTTANQKERLPVWAASASDSHYAESWNSTLQRFSPPL